MHKYCITSESSLQAKISLAVIFIRIFKEDGTMATAKYTKGKDGFFQAKVWDGTYTDKGVKHRVTLRTKKSSHALEEMVRENADFMRFPGTKKEPSPRLLSPQKQSS